MHNFKWNNHLNFNIGLNVENKYATFIEQEGRFSGSIALRMYLIAIYHYHIFIVWYILWI